MLSDIVKKYEDAMENIETSSDFKKDAFISFNEKANYLDVNFSPVERKEFGLAYFPKTHDSIPYFGDYEFTSHEFTYIDVKGKK